MRALFFCLALLLAAVPLRAQEKVQLSFSSNTASVGDPVELKLQIAGDEQLEALPNIRVDGLLVQPPDGPTGRTGGMTFDLGSNSIIRSVTTSYSYVVTPQRAGDFTVPAQSIRLGGRIYTTQPVALSVAPAGDAPARNGLCEIIPQKKSVYVGESFPVEIKLSIDTQVRFRLENLPTFDADSFTKTKLSPPRQTSAVKNGHTYDVISVRTIMTPNKAGKLTAGPATFQYLADIPRAQPRQPRGFGGIFSAPFFNDPLNGFNQTQRVTATSDPLQIEVKPLPIAGRPANFSGAVGQFSLDAQGSPARVKMGDPITMNVTVGGTGNFDRIGTPVLTDPEGWRAYPPTAAFHGDPATGITGTKSFEFAVIPEVKKDTLPVYEFSYFDPTSEKYVTLRSKAAPLVVEGDAVAPGVPELRGPTLQSTNATPTPPPAPKPTDILGIRYDMGELHSPAPLYTQRAFLYAQLVPFSVLCGMFVVRFWPRNREGQRLNRLRRERAALRGLLRKEKDRAAFYACAARLLRVDASLRLNRPADSIHAAEAGDAPIVHEIFDAHGESHYSGARNEAELPGDERRRILNALDPLLNRK